jgi:K+-transporting ATPase ATPase C chain
MREIKNALVAVIACSLALGLVYPLLMTGAAQALFPGKADGSLVERDGKVVGSRLIGQDFSTDPASFQSRPSATGYAPDATSFNNLGPNQKDLAALLRKNLRAYLERERPSTPGLTAAKVPPDAVTTSASGVDPQISEANALIQANRVARRRGIARDRVVALIRAHSSRPLLGLGGERSVNVLELNLALDREQNR